MIIFLALSSKKQTLHRHISPIPTSSSDLNNFTLLKPDLENALYDCVNFEINALFMRIFTNTLEMKAKQRSH